MAIPAIQNYHGTTAPMARFDNAAVLIPQGADPGAVIMSDPILSSPIEAVPMMRFSFKAPGGVADVSERYMVRQYDDHGLGPVGKRYRAIQPKDIAGMLSEMHRAFGLRFETAMLLEDGATFLTQASLKDVDLGKLSNTSRSKRDTGGRDILRGFLTVTDNYTGKRNATFGAAHTRAVCENTAAAAMRESKAEQFGRAIRHTGDVVAKLEDWQHAIEDALAAFDRFTEFASVAASTRISHGDAREILDTLIPLPANARTGKAEAKRDAIWDAFTSGYGNSGNTAWDLYNGVTEWANWQAPVRAEDANRARFESLMFDGLGTMVQDTENQIRAYLSI